VITKGSGWKSGDALLPIEEEFNIDLNNDQLIGSPFTIIEDEGKVTFAKDANDTYLIIDGDKELQLQNRQGQNYSDNTTPNWDGVAVELGSADSYRVLLQGQNARDGQAYVWTTNSEGVITKGSGWKSGDALLPIEEEFNIDLNNDQLIGSPFTIIEDEGTATFAKDADDMYLIIDGDKELQLQNRQGQNYSDNTTPSWDGVAVELGSADSYRVLLQGQNARSGQAYVWTTNSEGVITKGSGWKSGEALSDLEEEFDIDLNVIAPPAYVPDEILVKLKSEPTVTQTQSMIKSYGALAIRNLVQPDPNINSPVERWQILKFEPGSDVEEWQELLNNDSRVEVAEVNHKISINFLPNDPSFGSLWGLNNTGSNGGKRDADIDAPEAWDTQKGNKDVVVAVIDTGVDYNHPDLASNMWKNAGEIPGNLVDDDRNGHIDDVYGFDWVNEDGDPMDDESHGTHVAGTIGAVGNNNRGVVGVSPNVSIMSLKFLGSNGRGNSADAAQAIIYAANMGADIINASYGGPRSSKLQRDAIDYASQKGVLFVAAAGNETKNNDGFSNYPSNYNLPNVIAIAATDDNDKLARFSNYGHKTVDLGAPGVSILSTIPNNRYGSKSGTSMASPHVAGAAALVLAENPNLSVTELKKTLLDNTDSITSLQGKTVTGGRLNVNKAIQAVKNSEPEVNITSPTSTTSIEPGESHNIRWTDNFNDNVKLELYKGSSFQQTISSSTPSDGSYSWMVPTSLSSGTNYNVKIRNVNDSSVYDYSSYFTIIQGNRTPEVENDKTVTLEEDNTATLNIPAPTDPDGDTFTITVGSIPNAEIGQVVLDNTTNTALTIGQQLTTDQLTSLTFIPVANANGDAGTFSYIVDDGNDENNSATQVISINVTPVNDPPNALDDGPVFTTLGNQLTIDVLANDSDIDGPQSLLIDALPPDKDGIKLGLLWNKDTQIEFVSFQNFGVGTDTFEYIVTDSGEWANEDTATVTVNVINVTNTADNLVGGESNDNFDGGEGDDTLEGLGGNDTLTGNDGNDSLVGGEGNDSIDGGNGNDTFVGGLGSDILSDNNGDNTFVYTSANDGSGANFNAANATSIGTAIDAGLFDRITGFDGLGNVGGDTLEFSSKILSSLDNIATNVQTTDISENVLISGTPGLFMYEVEGKTYLIYDATGDNTVDDDSQILAELDINGVVALDVNDDFAII
jgi:subtilisin family serine protease